MIETLGDALTQLGVRDDTLTRAEKESLDRDGFVVLDGILTRVQIDCMLAEIERLLLSEATRLPDGNLECEQLQNRSDAFDVCVTHPRVLAAVRHVLGDDFVSQGVHSRHNVPGKGRQAIHRDGDWNSDGSYGSVNSIWPLVDFTVENGATRVVPGTHLFGKKHRTMDDAFAPHPDEVRLIIPAGSVAVFNGSLLHSAMPNLSDRDRPNVTSFWATPKKLYFDARLSETARRRLNPAATRLFPCVGRTASA